MISPTQRPRYSSTGLEYQKAAFEEMNDAVRKKIAAWQKLNLAMGRKQGTVEEYFGDLDEEKGGVAFEAAAAVEVALDPNNVPDIRGLLECIDESGGSARLRFGAIASEA